jgi:ATP-binding cassette subfamily B protein
LGDLTLFTQTATQVSSSFQAILSGISSTYENNLFVGTLFEFLEYEPKIKSPENAVAIEPSPEVKGLDIEFRNVSFTYPGKSEPALKNINFRIAPGEAIALVGRNGAGKTTLVKLLARLYDPDEGEIFIGGRNVKEYDLQDLREQVGVIFQDYATYFMTARENIGVGRLSEIENLGLVQESARKSGANTVIERLPKGYESMLGRWFTEGTQLSGGEWQKIALARAFIRDARILILDEPTSSLDAQAEYEVFAHFRELTEGKTAIFISHRFSTVRLADRIFVIENGTILESGSHRELMELDGRYAELFNLQAEAYR